MSGMVSVRCHIMDCGEGRRLGPAGLVHWEMSRSCWLTGAVGGAWKPGCETKNLWRSHSPWGHRLGVCSSATEPQRTSGISCPPEVQTSHGLNPLAW